MAYISKLFPTSSFCSSLSLNTWSFFPPPCNIPKYWTSPKQMLKDIFNYTPCPPLESIQKNNLNSHFKTSYEGLLVWGQNSIEVIHWLVEGFFWHLVEWEGLCFAWTTNSGYMMAAGGILEWWCCQEARLRPNVGWLGRAALYRHWSAISSSWQG